MTPTPLHNGPVPFITLPNWVKAAAHCGFNIQPVFRDLGIQTDLIHLESATIERPLLEQVMEACIARSKRQHFPFVLGETFAFDYLPDLETFLTTSPTLREALRVFDWVRELINPMINVHLQERGAQAWLILSLEEGEEQGRTPKPYFAETVFASVLKFGRTLLAGRAQFDRLCFRHAAPPYAAQYEKFFRMPVRFSQPVHALVLDRGLLDRPLEGGFPALHRQAQYRVEQRLTRLPKRPGLVTAIEEAFARKPRLLGQGIVQMAAELGLHARTLQRRLREKGQSYADLQGRVRYRLAMQFLDQTEQDIESISERLGFSDRRSFTRAFKRWSGVSPSDFRRKGK